MAITTSFDHFIYVVPDLAAGVAQFAEATGVQPVYGGAHVGLGTANYLVRLQPAGWAEDPRPLTYLEILGPDPDQALEPGIVRPLGVDGVDAPVLQTWAIHPEDFDTVTTHAADQGVDCGEVRDMSRRTPEGDLLEWRLTSRPELPFDGLQPFLIDWQDSPHPTTRDLPVLTVESMTLTHPDPAGLRRALRHLGVGQAHRDGGPETDEGPLIDNCSLIDDGPLIEEGPVPAMSATLITPRGTVTI